MIAALMEWLCLVVAVAAERGRSGCRRLRDAARRGADAWGRR